ncbi:Uncharacterised protein [Kurthia zopfii]|uniref:Uncharacterized protein n=1 Tax=Kurthia zopfii TaxID=1650 RepID=A0A8B4QF40_9BACL|nr:hypothetical protein [Kurthia zopfii]TDR32858.1 hypothetical protein DFR61_1601 [Kurthia zopfii]STX11224.1 Uncharacterised protein [Kurthia zopfii]VEI05422.1 Uncharacterised protein [Kurthia zopfii]
MTKLYFTREQQEQLKCNPNVQAVSEKAITYTDAFKRHFIAEYEKGKVPRENQNRSAQLKRNPMKQ